VKWYVYSLTNELNGRRYFGLTRSPTTRFRCHVSALDCWRHHNSELQEVHDKDGDVLSYALLAECASHDAAKEIERALIRNAVNAYNVHHAPKKGKHR